MSSDLLRALRQVQRLLSEASDHINSLDALAGLALRKIDEAERQLRAILQQDLSTQSEKSIKRLVREILGDSESLANSPLHVARVALDALVLYEQCQITERLPKWDIEVFREVAQKAKWRQEADSSISHLLSIIAKAIQDLEADGSGQGTTGGFRGARTG